MIGKEKILEVKHLKKYFNEGKHNEVKAIDDISFEIFKGETFGLVGESGCGKSTTGRIILRLLQQNDGEILFEGCNIKSKSKGNIKNFQKSIQMIFQDPYASLNPRMKIKDIITEGLDIHHLTTSKREREEKAMKMLEVVGLKKAHGERYPHEFSGGQRQRIGIARALAINPKLIIADEAISALDVSIQAQIVNLLKQIQTERNLTFLFIAHDLSMVRYISDRIGVMYKGKLVELAEANELYCAPLHPYTESLLSAIPVPDPLREQKRERKFYKSSDLNDANNNYCQMHEITKGHYVYCSEESISAFQKKRQNIGNLEYSL